MRKFTLRITWRNDRNDDEKIECEEISNEKTGEKLSIAYFDDNHMDHTLEIKRTKAEKKKGNKNGDK